MNNISVVNEQNSILVSHLSKSFGEKKVLDDLSLSFPYEKITCIMGKSGCGKTTLLNILLGIEKQDSGTVTGIPKKVSAVFQEDRLCEDFKVITNIKMATGRPENEILSCLSGLMMKESANTKVKELSGGMKRRVAIARALLSEHDLLIMDEPMKGLDTETRKKTASLIRETAGTMIIVTHDEAEAELLGAGIIRLS
ncbi:MAG: ATP-binding cassette domain-containing protein [Lachnospiraceae bacterium]|nr:ATP-binding cassette domain-containing protein [Lachnospiraceae bacterium]